jgi:hypothetical protein
MVVCRCAVDSSGPTSVTWTTRISNFPSVVCNSPTSVRRICDSRSDTSTVNPVVEISTRRTCHAVAAIFNLAFCCADGTE